MKEALCRLSIASVLASAFLLCSPAVHGQEQPAPRESLVTEFQNPPASCLPHTRWWWMGNALSKEDITWQLEEMKSHGIGGVEQISMQPVYEKGNVPYLSEPFLELLRHAVAESERLGLEFSLNFGGPGWVFGGDWVPQEDRSQNLLSSSLVVEGGRTFEGALSAEATINPRDVARSRPDILPDDRLVAVVAGRIEDGVLDESSLQVLTDRVQGRSLTWDVPGGQWRIMAFWLTYVDEGSVVDHVSETAMTEYFDYVGAKLEPAVGKYFGNTIESVFSDSFEVPIHRNGIYWNQHLMAKFREYKGYELDRYLPALWWEVDTISPKIRYDVNEFLHHTGMEAFFKPFLRWSAEHNVKARVQPYGFPTDILEGAGVTDLPEMEITAGEKDAVPWFDTRIGPKKYVASGAHLYGRNIVTVEAYTYQHWQPYRATLEELKIASDIFLRSGANKFYNQGITGIPERGLTPTRGFHAGIHTSPDNVWWPYYPLLSSYIARGCSLLRQGSFTADVALYSPLANQWTKDVMNARRWTRDFDWGGLGRLLIGNGYDYDLINDDILQNSATFENGALRVRDLTYRVLILPNIESLPFETFERIRDYVDQGGTVIALERVPEFSTGLDNHEKKDAAVKELAKKLFAAPEGREGAAIHDFGKGRTYRINTVMDRSDPLDLQSSAYDPFLKVLRSIVRPDLDIDFVRMGWRENPGLTFVHRRDAQRDIYFVTNVQEHEVDMPVAFRVSGKAPWIWNPYTGDIRPYPVFEDVDGATCVPLRLAPYASTFIVFEVEANPPLHALRAEGFSVDRVESGTAEILARQNGAFPLPLSDGTVVPFTVSDCPALLTINGPWSLSLAADYFPKKERVLQRLTSWTEDPELKHFSGTGVYTVDFDLSAPYIAEDVALSLDAGDVGNVADVLVNGSPAGVAWMRGQSLDITGLVRPGANHLEVRVTNVWINRVSGMTEPLPVPEELRERLGGGTRESFTLMNGLTGFEPLPRSGLLGPVRIIPAKRVKVPTGH